MPEVKRPVFLVALVLLWTFGRGDSVVCVFMDSCILPCSFNPGDDVVIHWIYGEAKTPVHAYFRNDDQLSSQDRRYSGRTSLFKEQISRGKASLKLTGVVVQDQGKYKCYTSTITGPQESYISLVVEAPVRKVNIEQVDDRITCSSGEIYPEPELTWSTSPPSSLTPPSKTTVQTEQQLYRISSSLVRSDSAPDLIYRCSVNTSRTTRRATLFKPGSITSSDTETTIPCNASTASLSGLIWRFNHTQVILNRTDAGVDYTTSEGWSQKVKGVSESGSLTLQGLTSDQDGVYTCELSGDEETYVTNVFLRVEQSPGMPVWKVILIVLLVIITIIITFVIVMLLIKRKEIKEMWIGDHLKSSELNTPERRPETAALVELQTGSLVDGGAGRSTLKGGVKENTA